MKTKLFLLMLLAASTLSAQNKLTVVIDGIEKVKGHIMVALYDKEGKQMDAKMEKIESESITIVFEKVLAGEYAVSVFQDENDNKKLDTGMFGIPKEKYGFSNNVKGTMGPPKFKERLFKIEEDRGIYITLL
ncbi:MAG: DUF2141 domain-containing protein [Dysgonamonadaceae bacterium]|jgi:uncharacterized protein (DUF2141 family)|nr:DUF2141 domain-containing protein [Dysgonamonadaceae bacterium]